MLCYTADNGVIPAMAGGRQREFCKKEALDKAMKVFWKKGYVGASLSDLTEGMGINKPSLYAAFGNKEQLFIQSAEYYIEHYVKPMSDCLSENKPLKERLAQYLLNVITSQCTPECPKGCFISVSISESESENFPAEAADMVEKVLNHAENLLTTFLNAETQKGNLDANTDAAKTARYLVAIMHGTAAMARGGKPQEELLPMIETVVNSVFVTSSVQQC